MRNTTIKEEVLDMKMSKITAKAEYTGGLRTSATHLKSGNVISTDAPVDNHGKGEAFSPTDLMATSLASCILTVMAIKAESYGLNMEGATTTVEKHMVSNPRRIGKLVVEVNMPFMNADEKQKKVLEHIAHHCPVGLSLHPELEEVVTVHWADV